MFVRLTGCPLRCTYCDTAYAFKEGNRRSINSIVEEVQRFPANLVEITGGEPLLQPGVFQLIRTLCDMGKTVLIETSGACDISGGGSCDARAIRIMDLKTPGSGECERNLWSNIVHLTLQDEVKFVIADRADFDWAIDIMRKHRLAARVKAVLFSAVFEQPAGNEIDGCEGLSLRDLAEWMLEAGSHGEPLPANVRMQTQLHKYIWEPQTRGV